MNSIPRKDMIVRAMKVSKDVAKDLSVDDLEKLINYVQGLQKYLKIYKEIDSFGVMDVEEAMDKIKSEMRDLSYQDQFSFIGYLWRELRFQKSIREESRI